MLRNGRPEDPIFRPEELLYRRYLSDHWVGDHFSPAGFRFEKDSGQSVNRQKFSEPEDVLFSEDGSLDGYGVLEFATRDIPPRLQEMGTPVFVFFLKHVPQEENYAHSEIWCETEQETGRYGNPSQTVRKKFRTMLSQHVTVRIAAQK